MSDRLDQLREATSYELAHPSEGILDAIEALGLRPGMHVLDVGCGAGVHLNLFANRIAPGGIATGLDIEADQLAVAADLHSLLVTDGTVRVKEGDLHQLPFDDASFDVAWMSAVLHHEVDPIDALAEMARVVKPGGVVAVLDGDTDGSFPCLPWSPEFEHVLRAAALRAQRENFGGTLPYAFEGYIGRRLLRLLREAGLVEGRMRAVTQVESGPLSAHAEAALCYWVLESFGQRVREYLAPHDWDRLTRSFTPTSRDYLPSQPGFFAARMSFLATAMVPAKRIT